MIKNYFNRFYFLFAGLISFFIYLFTLAPSVIQIDTGELAAVQATLGIAHPTGYPLYTMLGYLFSKIPLPFTIIYQLNLLAALYCASAISIFTYSFKLLLDNLESFQIKKVKSKKDRKKSKTEKEPANTLRLTDMQKYFAAIIAGLALALNKTFWFQSTSVEVYSLHLLLMSLIILSLLKAYLFIDEKEKIINKVWLLFAVFLALGFTNHMTTLLIIPGVAYLYFEKNRFDKRSWIRILLMILIFLPLLIIIYSYLPIRASQNPILNWSNPTNFEKIIRHISGFQYQVWLFSSTEAAKKQLVYFISNLFNEYFLSLLIALIGIISSYVIAKKFFIFNLITFLFTVFYSINYDIVDIDSYFLLAYVAISFFILFGIISLIKFLTSKNVSFAIATSILLIIVALQFYKNYENVNQRSNYIYENYTKSLLNNLPQNAIVFSYQWDYFISSSYYFQLVEDLRRDVTIVDKELIRRSWYFNQLSTYDPELLDGLENEIGLFKNALIPFERDEKFDANLLESLYRRIMTKLIVVNSERDFFVGPELIENEMTRGEFVLPEGYQLIPHLFLFKAVKDSGYVNCPDPNFEIKLPEKKDKYLLSLERFIGSMLVRRAIYEVQNNKIERAKIYLRKAAEDFPGFEIPPQLKPLILN